MLAGPKAMHAGNLFQRMRDMRRRRVVSDRCSVARKGESKNGECTVVSNGDFIIKS